MKWQSLQSRKSQSTLHFICTKLHSKARFLPVAKSNVDCPGRMLICYQLRNSENRVDNPFLGLIAQLIVPRHMVMNSMTSEYLLFGLFFVCFCDLDFNPIYPTQTKGKFVYKFHICPVNSIDQNNPVCNPSIYFMPYKYVFQCYLFS